ncbi:hypothetical protein AAIP55_001519 [Flavobacterium psychrophilum]|uniref:hypothetical protein n=1 Tax=Flavobacterium psychrophilum TaxID=96345 RepID=UPI002A1A083A|nr:hypothetical protein [Flavobacterium psychrophilum]EKT3963972.1 hypothetical protein [Flavobacterium psychrophilum]EKT4509668.1 hypothetical protein [Flavobacterium psychrophilum]EKT4517438.1 hypothetical protein [Flavobacterium psychrophilum]
MKDILFLNWHLMRWVRLVFAIFLFGQAYTTGQWAFIAIGLFFLVQVIFNLGCSQNGCTIPTNRKK